MSKVKTTHYKDGKPVETVEEDYVPTNMHITRRITRKYPQQFLICIVSDWVLVAVDAGVRLQVTR